MSKHQTYKKKKRNFICYRKHLKTHRQSRQFQIHHRQSPQLCCRDPHWSACRQELPKSPLETKWE